MDSVNEKSTYIVTVSFKDEAGAAVTPTQAWYSLYCETTSTEIKAETELTGLGTSKDVEITPEENKIQNSVNSAEVKVLTVRFAYGAKQGTAQYRYVVTNLQKLT